MLHLAGGWMKGRATPHSKRLGDSLAAYERIKGQQIQRVLHGRGHSIADARKLDQAAAKAINDYHAAKAAFGK